MLKVRMLTPHSNTALNNLEKFVKYLKKNKYALSILLILILAAILRFYNFNNHWGISNDDTRDISIAKEALLRKELPLIGSFSSAGPFVFGPHFYWTIMFSLLIFPFTILAPWLFIGIIGMINVIILVYCGHLLGGKKLAIITGFFAATSPQLIIRTLVLGQHSYVAFASSLLFLSFILLWQRQRFRYSFLMGASIGLAISMHYQALNLLIFFPTLLLIPKTNLKQKIFHIISMSAGFLILSLPLIIWDAPQQFANFRNILDYFLIGQYRFYVPNSWKIFLFTSFPQYWSFVIGGATSLGLILMISSSLTLFVALFKRKLPNIHIVSGAIFAILFIVNRYYRGERSEGYLLYFLPFILLFTVYTLYILIYNQSHTPKIKLALQSLGIALTIAIIVGNISSYKNYANYVSPTQKAIQDTKKLIERYPDQKFSVYDYKAHYSYNSQPLSFFLQHQDKIDPNGMKIGFSCNEECSQNFPNIVIFIDRPILDLSSETNLTQQNNWVNVNQKSMYDDLIGWSKKHELKSTFKLF
jgi:4-amino-4-deoxy-L-arabinose transferase-like glycosyltransferase